MKTVFLVAVLMFALDISSLANDPAAEERQFAHDAALVILVKAEPAGEATHFKIVEFWKRKASDEEIVRYFANGYLPIEQRHPIAPGALQVVYYYLPSSRWGDNSRFMMGPSFIDGKVTYNEFHESKRKRVFSIQEFKQLLANDQEPRVFLCPAK
jgi:hypothetical protein